MSFTAFGISYILICLQVCTICYLCNSWTIVSSVLFAISTFLYFCKCVVFTYSLFWHVSNVRHAGNVDIPTFYFFDMLKCLHFRYVGNLDMLGLGICQFLFLFVILTNLPVCTFWHVDNFYSFGNLYNLATSTFLQFYNYVIFTICASLHVGNVRHVGNVFNIWCFFQLGINQHVCNCLHFGTSAILAIWMLCDFRNLDHVVILTSLHCWHRDSFDTDTH